MLIAESLVLYAIVIMKAYTNNKENDKFNTQSSGDEFSLVNCLICTN